MSSDVDLNDLSILFDDEDLGDEKDSKKKDDKKTNWLTPVAIVVVISLVAIVALLSKENDDGNNTAAVETTQESIPEDLSVELVNLQQVAWAGKTCSLVKEMSKNKKELKPTGNKANPVKARKFISWDIDRNLKRLSKISEKFYKLPESSLAQAHSDEKETTPGDNNLKVGNEIDGNVSSASRGIASAIEGYSSALKSLQHNLNSIASYNFNGIRDGIENTNSEINNLNGQLSSAIAQNFSEDTFDNVATMEKVAELDSCAGMMIDKDELKKQKEKELDRSNRVNNIVSVKRCKSYLDNTSKSQEKSVKRNRKSCEDILSTVVIDPDDPLSQEQIDMRDDKRAKPYGEENNSGEE